MKMDEVLYSVAEKARNFAVFYLVDISQVPDFNKMYELYDPCTGNNLLLIRIVRVYGDLIFA